MRRCNDAAFTRAREAVPFAATWSLRMYRTLLWIAIGIVLALVAVFRIPSWPTATSTGTLAECPTLTEPVTRRIAERELERLRTASQPDPTHCMVALQQVISGERLREARNDWIRTTAVILVVGIGALFALYFSRLWRRWFRR
jgi:hypothetical protein